MLGDRERIAPACRPGDHDGALRLPPALRATELNAARCHDGSSYELTGFVLRVT